MNSTPNNSQTASSEASPVAFCQQCGRPLSKETVRVVGPAVYCEPCLAARLGGASSGPAYQPVNAAFPPAGMPYSGTPNPVSGWSGTSTARPHPGLAFLLGLIPGVGAMYNEQYAKGIAHLFVFALLVSLTHLGDTFGVFVFGWICYMAIEAHHTAKARRDGTPLPNPFGLNDIGERLGFDLNLHRTPPASSNASFAGAEAPIKSSFSSASVPPPVSDERSYRTPEPVATWGEPVSPPSFLAEPDPASVPYTQPWSGPSTPAQPPTSFGYPPAAPPYGPHIPAPPLPAFPVSRFPAGAIGLMVLGTFFLLSTTGIFHHVSGDVLTGFGLIGLGAWIFTRRFTGSEALRSAADGANYRLRTFRALTPSAWLVVVGVLMLLDSLRFLRWSHSWPWIIIFAGLLLLLRRTLPGTGSASVLPPVAPSTSGFAQPPGTTLGERR